jgi:hypothetical protein
MVVLSEYCLTLRAFANSSPGLRFGNPGKAHSFLEDATLKGLRDRRRIATLSQLLQSCEESLAPLLTPGFQSKPWAEIGQRFQRYFLESTKRFSANIIDS